MSKPSNRKNYFPTAFFVSLFIFAIAVLPALEYSWYAYIHELRQSVKKEQLEIADGLQQREKDIRAFLRNSQPKSTGGVDNFREIQFHHGILSFFCRSDKSCSRFRQRLFFGNRSRQQVRSLLSVHRRHAQYILQGPGRTSAFV